MSAVSQVAETTSPTPEEFIATAARIGREVLAAHADAVDAGSVFPHESIQAMREARMLGALIPVELGGLGLSIDTVSRAITELGKHCSSSAMVYAMHQIQVACLVDHGDTPALREYAAEVAASQLLLASATSEIGIGGDTRSSSCAVEVDGDKITLTKQAPVISYGQHADAILTTARRTPGSPPNDQVLVVCRTGTYDLDPTTTWDALGFRGTCSLGFVLAHHGHVDDVLPVPYGDISSQTMLPVSHVLWSSLWLGIASAAEYKARSFIQAAARRAPSVTPPGAIRLAELTTVLQQFTDLVEGGRRRYSATVGDPDASTTIAYAIAMNSLKVSASTLVVDVVQRCLLICGMAGYANRSPYTLGRLLRDSYGAQLMVNNDRIHANNSQLLRIHRGDSA